MLNSDRHVAVKRKLLAKSLNLRPDLFLCTAAFLYHPVNQLGDRIHLGLLHAPRSDAGRSNPYAAGHKGALGIEGDGVLVDGDVDLIEQLFKLLSGNAQV